MKFKLWMMGLPLLLAAGSASAETLSVKVASANFRARPHESAELKFTADKFFPVDVVEKKNGWVKVRDFEGDEAWVLEKTLGSTPSVVVSTDKANIREAANTASDVLFQVKRGEVFKIVERKEKWIKVVDANGDGGWIREDMVWGEPLLAEVVDKATEVMKSGANAKETSAAVDKVTEKVTEVATEATKVQLPTTSAKPPSATELEILSKKATEWASQPENLEALCRAYLEHSVPSIKPEKTSSKPKTEPKPAQAQKKASKPKTAEKVSSSSKPKSAEKPKKAVKKA
jgi:SH3-like domain-containing protein